jgi:hypothetical protein
LRSTGHPGRTTQVAPTSDYEDDLFAAALKQLNRGPNDPEIQAAAAAFSTPLHPNCYLSPTQFAVKFNRPVATQAAPIRTTRRHLSQAFFLLVVIALLLATALAAALAFNPFDLVNIAIILPVAIAPLLAVAIVRGIFATSLRKSNSGSRQFCVCAVSVFASGAG